VKVYTYPLGAFETIKIPWKRTIAKQEKYGYDVNF